MFTATWVENNKDRQRATTKEWTSKNPEKLRERGRRSRVRRWGARAVRLCRDRAAKKGVPFDMTKEDMLDKNTGKLPECGHLLTESFPNLDIPEVTCALYRSGLIYGKTMEVIQQNACG